MQIGTRFYRSLYVTLGLACACLGYAELAFLPEMSAFAALVGVLLVVAYRLEGRWSLTIPAANALGGVIAAGAVAWVAYQFFRPWGGTLLDALPWPTSLLPYLGPLLMILIPAKLFRPKHVGDYWGLQGVGLIAVALGCALAGDVLFGALLLAYLVSVMWSLTLFYYYREHQRVGAAGYPRGGPPSAHRLAQPPQTLGQAGVWACAVAGLALVLFLGTPRSGEARWELTLNSVRLQTGYDEARPGIDLNHNGLLRVNRDVVFEVKAFTDFAGQSPKTDLSPDQRWRGRVFNYYENGRWGYRPRAQENPQAQAPRAPGGGPGGQPPRTPVPEVDVAPAALDPDEYVLEFHPHPRNPDISILADPVTSPPRGERRSPTVVSLLDDSQMFPWSRNVEGELRPQTTALTNSRHVYVQRVSPRPQLSVGPPVAADENLLAHLRHFQSVPRLREWTRALVERLVDNGRLPAAVLAEPDPGDAGRVAPAHYERLARALEAFLSLSGEYRYSLNLRRSDGKLDPVEDFLVNTRKGHCNRFATALALMLRSQGVPTRMVLGFHGLETEGDGTYVVRQYQAHSWVEALIQRAEDGEPVWRWLTLDPTPAIGEDESADSQWTNWWESARTGLTALFKNFIVEYDADQQDRAYSVLSSVSWEAIGLATRNAFLGPDGDNWFRAMGILLGSGGVVILAWRWLRRGGHVVNWENPTTAFYRRLLDLLARHLGARPQGGQTPSEFAAAAGERLRAAPATRDLAGLPADTAVFYYRVRYGGRPLNDTERRALDGQLDRLEAALAAAAVLG